MADLTILRPKILARYGSRAWASEVAAPKEGWALRAQENGRDDALLLDWDLTERLRVPLGGLDAPDVRGLAFDLDRRRLGFSSTGIVAVCDLSGEPLWLHETAQRESTTVSECVFALDGEGLLVVTEDAGDTGGQLHLLDTGDGKTIAAVDLGLHQAGCEFCPHPDRQTFVLSAGEGQDGSFIFWVRASAHGLHVDAVPGGDRVFGGFDREGGRFLTMPHSSDGDNGIQVHAFPSCEVLVRLEWSDVFDSGLDDWFDFYGHFVDDEHVLTGTVQGRLFLMDSATLRPKAELVLEDLEEPRVRNGPGYAEDTVPIRPGRPGEFLSSHYHVGLRTWAIAP